MYLSHTCFCSNFASHFLPLNFGGNLDLDLACVVTNLVRNNIQFKSLYNVKVLFNWTQVFLRLKLSTILFCNQFLFFLNWTKARKLWNKQKLLFLWPCQTFRSVLRLKMRKLHTYLENEYLACIKGGCHLQKCLHKLL
jgi:hypothetical protein